MNYKDQDWTLMALVRYQATTDPMTEQARQTSALHNTHVSLIMAHVDPGRWICLFVSAQQTLFLNFGEEFGRRACPERYSYIVGDSL
jgi:hypothetical protein